MRAILIGNDGTREEVEFDPARATVEDIIFDFLRREMMDYHNEEIDLVDMWADWRSYVSVTVEEE